MSKERLPEWSDGLKEYTKSALLNLEFGTNGKGQVRMKRNDDSLGYITIADATSRKFNVHHDEGGIIDEYDDVEDMIEDGWVVD